VGKALPGWEIKITDESGQALAPGIRGEIAIRGPFMSGYYEKKEATARVIGNGWLHTGDAGFLDNNGNLYITGLQKDMLICKGQNIFPTDIEHVLLQHSSIAQATAVGVPDVRRGAVVGAALVLHKAANIDETSLQNTVLSAWLTTKLPSISRSWNLSPLKKTAS
jgi:acyl-CoA synthetase (AMP-forming)/AMP-acid ligase II